MAILYQDENSASGALAALLKKSVAARGIFLRLIFGARVPRAFKGSFEIGHLVPTDRSQEIDLLLSAGENGVIIECKVRDSQKVYQLAAYRDYWLRRAPGSTPALVWLVQRRQSLIGAKELGVQTIIWNELADALNAGVGSAAAPEAAAIERFIADLRLAAIVLPDGSSLERKKIYRGYDPEFACRLLLAIKGEFPELLGRVDQTNALTPALHVGYRNWSALFGDSWIERVYFYFKPTGTGDKYFLQGQVLLHHRHKSGIPFNAGRHFPIARVLSASGMVAWRNHHRGWSRREEVPDVSGIVPPLNYLYLEEPETAARKWGIHGRDDETAAVADGAAHLRSVLELVSGIVPRPAQAPRTAQRLG